MSSIPTLKRIAHPDLLAEIKAHCDAAGISWSEFGMKSTCGRTLVWDLERGRELRLSTREKIKRALSGEDLREVQE